MAIKNTLMGRISYRVKRNSDSVFLREDFNDIGGYDQVGRILRALVNNGDLIKLGYGLYARTKASSITGNRIPEKNLQNLAVEALKKLKVGTVSTELTKEYNSGLSTQVPTGRLIAVDKRFSRKIGYDGKSISYVNAA